MFGRPMRSKGFEDLVKAKQGQRKIRNEFTVDGDSCFSAEDLRMAQILFASMAARRYEFERDQVAVSENESAVKGGCHAGDNK